MSTFQNAGNRRSFLKNISVGAAGLALGSFAPARKAAAAKYDGSKSNVALVAGKDIRQSTIDSLKMIDADIKRSIASKKKVLIKVNMGQVTPDVWLNATDANQARGVIDYLRTFFDGEIIIGESSAAGIADGTLVGFENYKYMNIPKEYKNVRLVDLNREPTVTTTIIDSNSHPQLVDIIGIFVDPDVYIVSPTRLKTHNCVIGTFSHKNIAMASPVNRFWAPRTRARNQKNLMHSGGNRGLSYNLFKLAELGARPDLSILDGIQGMEGNGPVNGTPVEGDIVTASTDFVAADRIAYELIGVDYSLAQYNQWLSMAGMGNDQIEDMNLMGADYKDHVIKYKPHRQYETQIQWVIDDREKENVTDFNH